MSAMPSEIFGGLGAASFRDGLFGREAGPVRSSPNSTGRRFTGSSFGVGELTIEEREAESLTVVAGDNVLPALTSKVKRIPFSGSERSRGRH